MTEDGFITTGIFTVIGIIVGGIVAYYTSIKTIRRQEFNRLASRFHIALINQSRVIKRTEFIKADDHSDRLDTAFKSTETAFIEFSFFLCNKQRERINAIWHEYNNKNETHRDIVKFHGFDLLRSMNKDELRKNLLINIEKLLDFIKPK